MVRKRRKRKRKKKEGGKKIKRRRRRSALETKRNTNPSIRDRFQQEKVVSGGFWFEI